MVVARIQGLVGLRELSACIAPVAAAAAFQITDIAWSYNWVLPFTGLFLTPVYWLSTLPHLSAYRIEELREADFLPRAFGFLGQFVLVPRSPRRGVSSTT
jgi:hypothetical protein